MKNLLLGVLFFLVSGALLAESSFISVWQVDEKNMQVVLPLPHGFSYDFQVDWGDGQQAQVTAWDDEDVTHTYAQAGAYTITISGLVEAWSFWKIPQSKDMLVAVKDLGSVGWRNFFGGFLSCTNLQEFAGGNTTQVTDMRYMFYLAAAVTPDTSAWDTSNVTNMAGMFWKAQAANPDVSKWNVTAVADMSYMFSEASAAQPDVSNWNVALVKNMRNMFHRAAAATPDMRGWDFSNISNMHRMFWGVTLPTDIYSGMLVQLAATSTEKNVLLHGGYSKYNEVGAAARQELVGRGWLLIDGGRAPDSSH